MTQKTKNQIYDIIIAISVAIDCAILITAMWVFY